MKLEALFEGTEYSLLCGTLDKDVKTLRYRSDEACAGDCFFAIKGLEHDGHDYIESLKREGIEVFVVEEYNKDGHELCSDCLGENRNTGNTCNTNNKKTITIIQVENTRRALALASRNFFGKPDEELISIGITGTKGKTGTSYMLKAILERAGIKTGIIGTVTQGFDGHYRDAENTTPQSYELYKMLREMADGGCGAVVAEVSSQALMQHRCDGIVFDIGIFTNLSPDHIGRGEHKSFEEYAYWKSRLFTQSKIAVVNGDSPYAAVMLEEARHDPEAKLEKTLEYGLFQTKDIRPFRAGDRLGMRFTYTAQRDSELQDIELQDTELRDTEPQGKAETEARNGTEIELGLPGVFSVYNALAAIKAAEELGIKASIMAEALAELSVRGRTETVPTGGAFTVILDYAHNGVAMENLLKALRIYEPSSLTVLFGCGGNRDKSRRYEMGEAAARLADFSVITSDNPREEPPEEIIADIVKAVAGVGGTCTVIPDRKKAIEQTIQNAEAGSIIAVCGKGHETYQIIGHEKIHFDDREIIRAVAENREMKL